jgi:hypothetical protein
MRLEFVTQSSRNDADWSANTERLVNLYPEPMPEGGAARYTLRSVLGSEDWAQLPGVFLRDMAVVPTNGTERLYASMAGRLWDISPAGLVAELGVVSDCPETTLAGNNGVVCVVCGGTYRIWDGTTLSFPAAGAFSDFGAVEFLGGYTILTERNGRKFQWSALADASTLPGLNFATAEARDDALVRPVAVNGNLWLFKKHSTEIWALTGLAGENAFTRLGGGVHERGLLGVRLVAKAPNAAFFVGDDGVCYITNGAELAPVSRTPVETAIKDETPTHCFYYEDEGHKFCVVRFRNRPAWVYDLSTGLWHERASLENGWKAVAGANVYGAWRTGGDDGRIVRLARNNRDNGDPLIREATSQTLDLQGGRFRVPAVEFMGRVGRTDIGRDAQMMVQFSRDGGNTWGAHRWRSMGDLGEYDKRLVFRSVGQARRLTARIRITDPTDLRLWSAANVAVV